jgi:hypothetical protein
MPSVPLKDIVGLRPYLSIEYGVVVALERDCKIAGLLKGKELVLGALNREDHVILCLGIQQLLLRELRGDIWNTTQLLIPTERLKEYPLAI